MLILTKKRQCRLLEDFQKCAGLAGRTTGPDVDLSEILFYIHNHQGVEVERVMMALCRNVCVGGALLGALMGGLSEIFKGSLMV